MTSVEDNGTHTGVRPKDICGALPLLTLSRSSSTISCVMSSCMACIGGEWVSLDSMSLSGAPTRAMPPAGSSAVAMMGCWSDVSKRGGSRCQARTRMPLRVAMHGESTQALRGEQAVQTGRVPVSVTEASDVCEAVVSLESDGGANKGPCASEDCQTRSDCHSAVVRNPANKRARVARYDAETIGCHGQKRSQTGAMNKRCTRRRCRSRVRSSGSSGS
ncbi:hypothetical protein DE146DRAFT_142905 [Phaeosphaeria sp. MPI-PUGE-AT-0046c]|nr:hypothetical protein DE146DRAFT_142905 [Phaeosphaeria sp. MPI-PUGE-AT-0046c]